MTERDDDHRTGPEPSAALQHDGLPHDGQPHPYPAQPGYGAPQAHGSSGQAPQGYGPPPGYGAPPAWPGPYGPPVYVVRRATNGMAVASMVLGILWIYWIGSILALVFGYVARQQIKQRGDGGDGMAIAGIVLGYVGLGLGVLGFVLAVGVGSSGF